MFLLTLLPSYLLTFTSCSQHEDEIFDTPAAERVEQAVEHYQQILEEAPNGWELHYYTGADYSGSGYTFLIRFHNGHATVASDLARADTATTSVYKIDKSEGPVLTFDTYNPIMHYLAEPTQSDIDGAQGDYEFVITRATADSVYLRGKKWGNQMVMTRLAEGTNWRQAIQQMQQLADDLPANYRLLSGNDSIGKVTIDAIGRRAVIATADTTTDVPFCYTTTGIELQRPVAMGGHEGQQLTFDSSSQQLTADGGVRMQGFRPAGYLKQSEWAGEWTLTWYRSTGKLTLSIANATEMRADLAIGGYNYTFYLPYNRAEGTLSVIAQYISDPSGTYPLLVMIPASVQKNLVINDRGAGMNIVYDEATGVAQWQWNSTGATEVDSFIFLAVNNDGTQVTDENGYAVMPQTLFYPSTMTRTK